MEGEELRQTLVTIGISIVLADLMLVDLGRLLLPDRSAGLARRARSTAVRHRGEVDRRTGHAALPAGALVIFAASVVLGIAMSLVLQDPHRHDHPGRRRRPRHARCDRRARSSSSSCGLRLRRGAGGTGGRGRRHLPVAGARRGYAFPPGLARGRHRGRHGQHPGRGARRPAHRGLRAIRAPSTCRPTRCSSPS